jgi:hypothetical protein
MGVSEAFDFLLPLFCTNGFRPDPRELGIVNRADILLFQFGFDVIDKFTHSKKSGSILGTFKDGQSNQFIQTIQSCGGQIVAAVFVPAGVSFPKVSLILLTRTRQVEFFTF